MKKTIAAVSVVLACGVNAAELQHHFNSPAFSGIGWSSHVLTIQQLENQAKEKNKAEQEAQEAKLKAEAANTPAARFLANVESRIFSQLAKQMTDSLFGEGSNGCSASSSANPCGVIENVGGVNGSTISWWKEPGSRGDMIHINVTGPSGNTSMVVPANTFFF